MQLFMHPVKYLFGNFKHSLQIGGCSLLISTALGTGSLWPVAARTHAANELPLLDSVSIDGITWRFGQKAPAGRFVNGDYYVVGNVSVVSVNPAPDAERNGSVLNLPIDPGISGFDSRASSNRFRANLRASFPLGMKSGDVLISSIIPRRGTFVEGLSFLGDASNINIPQ
jgi:hypothetical protein